MCMAEMSQKEEAINNMIKEISMRVFLKATPYASGNKSDLENGMDDDFFYNYLYSHSQKAEKYLNEILDRINRDLRKNIILYGYQGCGKTTFVHYILRRFSCRSLLINFDAYVDNGNEIRHELASHLYRVIMWDVEGEDGTNGHISPYKLNGQKCTISRKFCDLYNRGGNRRTIIENYDSWSTYTWLFDKLEYTMRLYSSTAEEMELSYADYIKQKAEYPIKDLKEHIAQLDVNQLMVVIVLWDIAYSLAFGKEDPCCIVFENLDTIYNASALPDFTKQILYFRNNIDSILSDLQYEGKSLSRVLNRYTLIFVMRETTKCEFADHFVGKVEMYIPPESMSFLYELKDIVKQRNSYIHKLEREMLERKEDISSLRLLKQQLDLLEEILLDPYIANKMFGLFNHNLRAGADILSEVIYRNPDALKDVLSVRHMSTTYNWSLYASRCVLFRHIFNKFNEEKYFELIKDSEYHIDVNNQTSAVNLCRYILLYLNNRQGYDKTDEQKEGNMVPLSNLFRALLTVCRDNDLIVNSIWSMYEMRKKLFWGHLITFDGILTLNKDVLEEQLNWVISHEEKGKVFGKVRITTAGFTYLETLLPHFEYFAARCSESSAIIGKSLFACSLKELLNVSPDRSKTVLAYTLSNVREEFGQCYRKLAKFYRTELQSQEEYSLHNFPDCNFAWRKISPDSGYVVKMFHGERVIHSHIGYLDSLRFYCFALVDNILTDKQTAEKIDLTKVIPHVMGIRGISSHIPAIAQLYNLGIQRCILCMDRLDDVEPKNAKIEVVLKNGEKEVHWIPVQELIKCLKIEFNYEISNAIKEYLKIMKPRRSDECIVASKENVYLVSCYLACINENIQKSKFTDFTTSICRKTGSKILSSQFKSKRIRHRTQWGKQELQPDGGHK